MNLEVYIGSLFIAFLLGIISTIWFLNWIEGAVRKETDDYKTDKDSKD